MIIISRLTKYPWLQQLISYGVFGFLVMCIMGSVALTIGTWAFSIDLPSPDQLTQRSIPQSTEIYDRHGKLLYQVYRDQNRTLVSLEDIPQVVIDATLAAEDQNFYEHGGIDFRGMAYAAYQTLVVGHLQGGSTITQQLVKQTLLSDKRTLDRKIKEAILSMRLEQQYSKDQILQMYLNEVPYGGEVYGIKAAAKTYFNKDLDQLTLSEAALLAGLPQSPTNYSPFTHPQMAAERQHHVLNLMAEAGLITQTQAEEAKLVDLAYASPEVLINAPWFTLWVKAQLEAQYGQQLVEEGGLRVTTTLDLDKQGIAEEEVGFQLDRLATVGANAHQAALLSMDPQTGEILSMVGSRDYFDREAQGNVNGTLAWQQPGSSIKPFVYLTGFMTNKITPATLLNDKRTVFNAGVGQPPYIPRESDGKYWGPILARDALANSRNIPTVQVMEKIGVPAMITTATKAGIPNYDNNRGNYGLSLSLGAGEVRMIDLAAAYATLANNGVYREPVAILKVETADGKILYQYQPGPGQNQIDPRYSYLVTNILSDNKARERLFGPNNLLELTHRPAAVKTGTTDDNRDAWTVGFTPDVVTAVWVGNFDNTPMQGVMGATGATPIWHYYMERVLKNTPVSNFTRPDGLIEKPITKSGHLSCSSVTTYRLELFVKGTEPQGPCYPFIIPDGEIEPRRGVAGEQIWRQERNGRSIRIQYQGNGHTIWKYID